MKRSAISDFADCRPGGSKGMMISMEEHQADDHECWTWSMMRRNHVGGISPPPSADFDSWEEQAFAEDALGPLGGCVWPPRSYSCSFCRREFRSAQALGGHMNVHRRDRARLQQQQQQQHQSLLISPTSTCSYKPTLSRVSATTAQEDVLITRDIPTYSNSSSCFPSISPKEYHGDCTVFSAPWSDSVAVSIPKMVAPCNPEEREEVETDLSMNSSVVSNNPVSGCDDDCAAVRKKQRINTDVATIPVVSMPLSVKPALRNEEELDLELRLGVSPPPDNIR